MSGLTIGDVLANARRRAPGLVAASARGESITFGELDTRSNHYAHALTAREVARGDRIVWLGDTTLAALPVFGATAKLGAPFAPLNALLSVAEAAPVAAVARPRLIVSDRAHRSRAQAIADELGVDAVGVDEIEATADDIGAPTDAPPAVAVDERDPHVLFFTSGSTGAPKAVVLSHRANWLRSYPGATAETGAAPTVCMFPLFHMAGWSIALGAWQARTAIHFVAPDPHALLSAIEEHRAARLYAIPAVWRRILEHGVEQYDLASLRAADTGTSATPPELLRAIKDAFPHTQTGVFYGSTEAGPGTRLGDEDLFRKPGSCGRAQPGVDLRLDPDSNEVCLRSEFLMDGYFDDPDATAAALRDGWYHTGDLGVLDDEGYLSIVGRVRDVIRTGGETVSPSEVEAVLASHPAIAEVAVVGIPDPQWGELVVAAIVPKPGGSAPDVEALRAYCDDCLAPFKHPRRVVTVEALPRTAATGQVQRTLLVEQLQA